MLVLRTSNFQGATITPIVNKRAKRRKTIEIVSCGFLFVFASSLIEILHLI